MFRLSALSACVRFYAALLGIAVIFLALDAGSCLLRGLFPEGETRRRLARHWLHCVAGFSVRFLHRMGILDCDLRDLTSLRDETGLVLVANHPSRLDSLILAAALPRMVCVTKASIWERPTLGTTLRTAGYIRHDSLLKLIGPATDRLKEGCQVLLFPEGTRSRADEDTGPLQPGFAAIAQRTRSTVQPILIETSSPYLSQGWPFLRRPPLPMRYQFRLAPRFPAPARDEASGRALVETTARVLKQGVTKTPTQNA
ncbi:lysophospholipid acyltransferase family protein [Acetobacter persici]|uniref:lysophospholipid acyltransferase family protein n=1 Tax=Acetobacter persici TaxID=1076596 RepID=UPI001F30450A|nr:lysophospholipid acyltransferase family protein [Acetobacter persici]MCG0997089.1 1-acyl-sn-glycerol-3-phosphate acyltransferase [Acetobacter persici]